MDHPEPTLLQSRLKNLWDKSCLALAHSDRQQLQMYLVVAMPRQYQPRAMAIDLLASKNNRGTLDRFFGQRPILPMSLRHRFVIKYSLLKNNLFIRRLDSSPGLQALMSSLSRFVIKYSLLRSNHHTPAIFSSRRNSSKTLARQLFAPRLFDKNIRWVIRIQSPALVYSPTYFALPTLSTCVKNNRHSSYGQHRRFVQAMRPRAKLSTPLSFIRST